MRHSKPSKAKGPCCEAVLRNRRHARFRGSSAEHVEWCDRRLLARIHRLTLQGLRQQIQPVEPREFMRFLTRYHHLAPDNQWGGAVGVREAIGQLQGFELPAGAWEQRVLAARVAEYDPAVARPSVSLGRSRLGPLESAAARRRRTAEHGGDDARGADFAGAARRIAAAAFARSAEPRPVRSDAADRRCSTPSPSRGALFFSELKVLTQLLPGHLEEALRELAALGLITSDAFAAVRKIVDGEKPAVRAVARGARLHASRGADRPLVAVSRASDGLLRASNISMPGAGNCCAAGAFCFAICSRARPRPQLAEIWSARCAGWSCGAKFAAGGLCRGCRRAVCPAGRGRAACVDVHAVGQRRAVDRDFGGRPDQLVRNHYRRPRIPATHRNALIVQAGQLLASRQAGHVEFYRAARPSDPMGNAGCLGLGTSTQSGCRRALLRRGSNRDAKAGSPLNTRPVAWPPVAACRLGRIIKDRRRLSRTDGRCEVTVMISIQHILVPTDFSEPSDAAVKYGRAFAESFRARAAPAARCRRLPDHPGPAKAPA